MVTALETDAELQEIRDSSPQYKRLFELAVKLEGSARHSSIHAAGVVISDKPLREYVPLAKSGDDIVTQWQMTELEEVGLLKMDFLGLKTLTILQEGARLVKEVHGVDIDLDYRHVVVVQVLRYPTRLDYRFRMRHFRCHAGLLLL